jgi:glycosyltransferase involved in cell wall biosynthesis
MYQPRIHPWREEKIMRILLISHSYTDPGYWDKLDALGQRVELAVVMPEAWRGYLHPAAPVPPNRPDAPWKQYRLKATWQGMAFRYLYDPRRLDRVLEEFRPDLVHVEEEPESLSLLQISLLRRRYGFRLVFFSWENVNPQHLGWPVRQLTFGAADAAIVGNRAAVARCTQLGFRKSLALIPQYGFDIAPQPNRASSTPDHFVVGYAGRLVAEKGLRTLAEATRSLPDTALLLAGSGAIADELAQQPHVTLLGALQRHDMDEFWQGIDVLALPSLTTPRWAEQFGRVLIEAMARGVPVLGSSSGAIPEVIGDAGLIFPEGDAPALAAAIQRIRDSAALRADLIARGLDRARHCYSQDVIMNQIVDFYRQVLGRHATA